MIGHENVIFRKDESVEFGKLFWTALVGIVLVLAGLGKDLWASKLWPLLLVLLVIAAALQAAGKTRELPELVELQGHELFVQISRNEHYRIPIDVVRALEVSGEDVCFVFRKKEANALGLAIPKKAKRHLSRLLGRLDSPSGTDHGDGAFEFTMPKAALEALLSRMAKQFKFALWADYGDRAVYWPQTEWPAPEAEAVSRSLVCSVCGRSRPSRFWFQDAWGRPVPECTDCQEVRSA
jgi:hypothetical protein